MLSAIYEGNYDKREWGTSSVRWHLDTETGILTISGTGDMHNWGYGSTPYYSYVNYIKSLVIEEGITSIGDYAFIQCTNLESVSLPNSIKSIGDNAFSMCEKLPSITIPNSVITIKSAAFTQCRKLATITIPSSVTEIPYSIFSYCTNLTEIIVDSDNKVYDSRNGCNAIMETATDKLVSGCINTTIPSDTKTIGANAFYGCTYGFTSFEIPEGVDEIGSGAFQGCIYLKEISLPSTLKRIQSNAFQSCYDLTSIVIPVNVESIGYGAFANCSLKKVASLNLTPPTLSSSISCDTLYVPYESLNKYRNAQYWKDFENIIALSPYDFEANGCYYKILSKTDLTCEVTYKENYSYDNYKAYSGSVSIPSTVVYKDKTYNVIGISDKAFQNCYRMDSINISNTIERIGNYAFENCSKLTEINIPNSVKDIGYGAFSQCNKLTTIILPNAIEKVKSSMFAHCQDLASITFSSNVASIGDYVLLNCNNLSEIMSLNPTPPTISQYTFSDNNSGMDCYNATLYVPYKAKKAYTNAEYWKNFKKIVEIVKTYKIEYVIDDKVVHVDSVKEGTAIPSFIPEKAGYTFNGWENVPSIMPSNDIIVKGSFTANEYLLSYVIDGALYEMRRAKCDASIETLNLEEKEGHSFIWENWVDIMPPYDYTLRGKYIPNTYCVQYMVDGDTIQTDSVAYGTEIIVIDKPTQEGYTFSGWSEVPETMPASDVTISGFFTINKYLVTFRIGDEVIAADSLEYGALIIAPEVPKKEGHTFNGWGEVAETVPSSDLTYEGSYTVNSYLLTYVIDGDTIQTDSVAYGAEIIVIDKPTQEGYTFSGWSEVPETMPASDVTISGFFTINKYLVTFRIGDEVIAADSLEYGALIIAPEVPKKEGHTFNGWGEVAEAIPANDLTYEGSYSVNSYLLTYVIDGDTIQADSVAYGTEIIVINEPTQEGYTFSGWSEVPATMPAKDVIISGIFTINKYLVTFKIGDDVIAADSLEYGDAIVVPDAPVKEGHTFNGWGDVAKAVPASDLSYEGYYSVNSYLLTYIVDGDTIQTDSVAYGTAITPIEEPTKEGYTFSGWGEIPETMPANDVTISGTLTINQYTVTYVIDGEVFATDTIAYGEGITLPDVPVKEGYEFAWTDEIPETMPAENIVITGAYTTGILNAIVDEDVLYIYTTNGQRVNELRKGINIVLLKDGSIRKVFRK